MILGSLCGIGNKSRPIGILIVYQMYNKAPFFFLPFSNTYFILFFEYLSFQDINIHMHNFLQSNEIWVQNCLLFAQTVIKIFNKKKKINNIDIFSIDLSSKIRKKSSWVSHLHTNLLHLWFSIHLFFKIVHFYIIFFLCQLIRGSVMNLQIFFFLFSFSYVHQYYQWKKCAMDQTGFHVST